MRIATATAAPAASIPERPSWLYGAWLDLLVGYGLGYVAFVPLLLGYGFAGGAERWPGGVVAALAIFVNGPHYGATIVRAYARREDRAKYRVFTIYATLALFAAYAFATHDWWAASAFITVYLTWSPWHFAGQNYGIALMFVRRRGVVVDPALKQLLSLSFVLSAALTMLAIHGGAGEFGVRPTPDASGAPRLLVLGLPRAFLHPLLALAGAAYVACLFVIAQRLRRIASPLDQLPVWALVSTQALWFVVPVALPRFEHTLPFAAVWISTAHSAQYLWITAYYVRRSRSGESAPRFLLQSLVAGSAITVLPGLLFAPDLLGSLPWDAGLAMLTFAAVNIHHFLLDGAIWKLRDGCIARVLLNAVPAPGAASELLRSLRVRAVVWGVAGLTLAAPLVGEYETRVLERSPTPERVESAVSHLRWVGREPVRLHLAAGRLSEAEDRDAAAISHYRRSLELFPTAQAWRSLGRLHERRGELEVALAAYRAATDLKPAVAELWLHCAELELALARANADPAPRIASARIALQRVLDLAPDNGRATRLLARLDTSAGTALPAP